MRISMPFPKVPKPERDAGGPSRLHPAETDLHRYELTPFGRRPKRRLRGKVLVSVSLLGAAAVGVWLLL